MSTGTIEEATRSETKEERRARKAAKKMAAQSDSIKAAAPALLEDVAQPAEIPLTEMELKEQRKARKAAKKLAKEAAVTSAVDQEKDAVEAPRAETKEERKARKKSEKMAQSVNGTGEASIPEAGPSRLTGASDAGVNAAAEGGVEGSGEPANAIDEKKKKKEEKKRKREMAESTGSNGDTAALSGEGVSQEVGKKVKKSKKGQKGTEAIPDAPVSTAAADGPSSSSAIFADPALSDQAKKALHYVHLHAISHNKAAAAPAGTGEVWKFNKAKQNWLMRNVWSDVEVPEGYLDGVMDYLKTVQASSRRTLIEDAKKLAKAPDEPKPEEEAEARAEGEEAEEAPTGTEEAASSTTVVDDALTAVKRARAQRLLKVLGAR